MTGCAEPGGSSQPTALPSVSIARYSDTVVELDYAHGTASLPADSLDSNSPENSARVTHAIAARTDTCMVDKGFDAIAETVDWGSFAPAEDRVLGRWSAEYASVYGAERAADNGPPQVDLVRFGVEFNRAYATCQDSAKEKLRPELEFLQTRNIIAEVKSRAYEFATKSADGTEAIAAWKACSEKAGVVLDPADGFPVEEYKRQGKQAEITAYVTHAECARSTGAIQTVFNLRARYELALMDERQEQVAAFTKKQEAVAKTFDDAIAEG